MNVQIAGLFDRVAHRQLGALGREDYPAVAYLAARFRIERRLVDDDANVVAGLSLGDALPIAHDRVNDALGDLGLIAEKLGGADLLAQREPYRLGRRLARSSPALARFLALPLHCRREALDRHPAALTAQPVLGQTEREAEGVVEPEGDLAGQCRAGAEPRRLLSRHP